MFYNCSKGAAAVLGTTRSNNPTKKIIQDTLPGPGAPVNTFAALLAAVFAIHAGLSSIFAGKRVPGVARHTREPIPVGAAERAAVTTHQTAPQQALEVAHASRHISILARTDDVSPFIVAIFLSMSIFAAVSTS